MKLFHRVDNNMKQENENNLITLLYLIPFMGIVLFLVYDKPLVRVEREWCPSTMSFFFVSFMGIHSIAFTLLVAYLVT